MDNSELKALANDILDIINSTKNKDELFLFLRDLLTEKELIEFSKRLEVAKMLQDKIPYTEIQSKTKMSSTTVARVAKYLNWENNWYRSALSKLKSVADKHHTDHQY